MKRFLIVLALIGVAIWFGEQYFQQPSQETASKSSAQTDGDGDGTGSAPQASNASGNPASQASSANSQGSPGALPAAGNGQGTASMDECRTSLRTLANAVLQPIESSQKLDQTASLGTLVQIRTAVSAFPSHPEYARTMQACAVLQQAIQERGGFVERSQRVSQSTDLDKVSGQWFTKDVSLSGSDQKKSVNLAEMNQQSRTSLFAQAALNQWRARCNDYRPVMANLLAP